MGAIVRTFYPGRYLNLVHAEQNPDTLIRDFGLFLSIIYHCYIKCCCLSIFLIATVLRLKMFIIIPF